jgi:uncharacterized GH25 family protein
MSSKLKALAWRAAPAIALLAIAVAAGEAARADTLKLKPLVHPNDVYLDTTLKLKVLLDGKPVPNQEVEIWREGGGYDEPKFNRKIKSGADGGVDIKFNKPGAYLIWTRMSGPAPAGAQTPVRSYTTSLTLEVTQ